MAFELIPLPYDSEALAPAISAETLSFHHGKHHKAYLDKTNAAIAGTDLEGEDLETVIARARGTDRGLFNNAAQSWNHGFYWHSLSPETQQPAEELAARIDDAFGSLDALKDKLADRGAGHFASGWVALAVDHASRKLEIVDLKDHEVVTRGTRTALLILDVWEHAYYLKYQNRRPEFIDAFWNVVNWAHAGELFARAGAR